jgi:hypothetical protein
MKKISIWLLAISFSISCYSQTCEQKLDKLLESTGSLSAALLYNTYGLIGSISDGFSHEGYDAKTVVDLLDFQNRLLDNLTKVFDGLISENYLANQSDRDFANSAINILKGLKKQSQLMQDYTKNQTIKIQQDYEAQRTKNWKDISALTGIKDE